MRPWLTPEEVQILQREDAQAWTVSDLPLLDAARLRLGDPQASRRRRQREATVAAERAAMDRVVEDLVAGDDDGEGLVTMLRQPRIREMLVDDGAVPTADPDVLKGPFAHIVVDKAQELTDAEWQMLLRRCPSRSFTVVGDRAQARRGFSESWTERLDRVGLTDAHVAPLTLLPHTSRGYGRGRARRARRRPGRQRPDLSPSQRNPRHPRRQEWVESDPGQLAHHAHRWRGLRHR